VWYFPVWPAPSPWNTQAAHARDLRTLFDFLWFARGQCAWRNATVNDRATYEWWRRRDEHGSRVEDVAWNRLSTGQRVVNAAPRAPAVGEAMAPLKTWRLQRTV
jgi:uncharacterized heparinase superfamily protein